MTSFIWAEDTVKAMAVKDPALCALALYANGWRCAGLDKKGYQTLRLRHDDYRGDWAIIPCTLEVFNLIELIQRERAND